MSRLPEMKTGSKVEPEKAGYGSVSGCGRVTDGKRQYHGNLIVGEVDGVDFCWWKENMSRHGVSYGNGYRNRYAE